MNFPVLNGRDDELLTHFSFFKERHKHFPCKGEIGLLIACRLYFGGKTCKTATWSITIFTGIPCVSFNDSGVSTARFKNEQIQLVNFWPNMELNEYINLESRVKAKWFYSIYPHGWGKPDRDEWKRNDRFGISSQATEQLQSTVLDLEDIRWNNITDTNITFGWTLWNTRKTTLSIAEYSFGDSYRS